MNITKNIIAKKISAELNTTDDISKKFVNSFFNIMKKTLSSNNIKFSKFGTFSIVETPERVGRNPKTLKEHKISKKLRLSFKPSNIVRKILN